MPFDIFVRTLTLEVHVSYVGKYNIDTIQHTSEDKNRKQKKELNNAATFLRRFCDNFGKTIIEIACDFCVLLKVRRQ